jgi:hypothetical protein
VTLFLRRSIWVPCFIAWALMLVPTTIVLAAYRAWRASAYNEAWLPAVGQFVEDMLREFPDWPEEWS